MTDSFNSLIDYIFCSTLHSCYASCKLPSIHLSFLNSYSFKAHETNDVLVDHGILNIDNCKWPAKKQQRYNKCSLAVSVSVVDVNQTVHYWLLLQRV